MLKSNLVQGHTALKLIVPIGIIAIIVAIVALIMTMNNAIDETDTIIVERNHSETTPISHWQTEHGIEVYFSQSVELPIVDIRVLFRAGSAYDTDHPGLAQLTSRLLNEGTEQKNADEIAEGFENVGALFSTGISRDAATVSLRSLTDPNAFTPALNLFTQILSDANFPQAAFEREQTRLLSSIAQKAQQPSEIAMDTFFELLYGDHPYAKPVSGTADTVQALTRDEVSQFFNRYYVDSNAIIALVGDLSLEQAQVIAQQIDNALSQGEPAPALPEPQSIHAAQNQHIEFPSAQTHILQGTLGIAYNDPDYFPLFVGNYIFGGGGFESILFDKIRVEHGLAYSVGTYFRPQRVTGPFIVNMQTRADQAGEALELTQESMQQFINQGPSAEQLTAAKEYLTGNFALQTSSNRDLVGYLAAIAFYGLPIDYLDTYQDNISAVNLEQVQQAFAEHINPDELILVEVGQSESPDQQS